MTAVMLDPSLVDACARVGLSCKDATLLRAHATGVYLLPRERIVARVSSRDLSGRRVQMSIQLTGWLADQGIPVTEPALDEAIDVGSSTVAFWNWYPQQADRPEPAARELGAILRQLHALPHPPFDLPKYPPLQSLLEVLAAPSVLSESEREWLSDRAAVIVERYHGLRSEIGVGFVHGDAYPGNTLWGPTRALLGDWDEAAVAPRELDLVNTCHGARFGSTEEELREFTDAYGWDVRDWEGFPVLLDMRDLHTLSAYIRRATRGDGAAEAELRLRLHFLRDPSLSGTRWRAVG
ncbi:phosphotransferase [Millisia brevis]|uniref:phosphotransferase n=1 Tax=Millisia brevis TaxID=264148 RepID=UPI000833B0C2|nr:aminoglycoside phosphotransferase family protein [Millisia brevis]